MPAALASTLWSHAPEIERRWQEALRGTDEPPAIADPRPLSFMVDWACASVLSRLGDATPAEPAPRVRLCADNPLVPFFEIGEEAVVEQLCSVEPGRSGDDEELAAAVREARAAVRWVRNHEIASFCAVCPLRVRPRDVDDQPDPACTAASLDGGADPA